MNKDVQQVTGKDFRALLTSAQRNIRFTNHALKRLAQRCFTIEVVEKDLKECEPALVIEQESDTPSERKFDVYYTQKNRSVSQVRSVFK